MKVPLPRNLPPAPFAAIVGPTGSGKSELAIRMAERFGGEILNCDSVQIYRFFDIGSAKTPESEQRGIPHHLTDVLDPNEVFTAGDFSRAGRLILHEIAARGHLPIAVGGTGFYLRALIEGLAPGPRRNESLRTRLAQREQRRPGSLHRILKRLDPRTAVRLHPNDIPKIVRALEICMVALRPAAELFAEGREPLEGFRILKIALFPDRDQLYQRLESRLEQMFAGGLIEETTAILARGFPESSKPFEAIGYKQAVQIIRGELSVKDALFYARRDTRRYAKRQMTWFRREPGIRIVRGFGDDPLIAEQVGERIEAFLECPDYVA